MMRFRWVMIILGVALALIAIRFDSRVVAWVALGVLAIALALRFATPRRTEPDAGPNAPTDSPGDDSTA